MKGYKVKSKSGGKSMKTAKGAGKGLKVSGGKVAGVRATPQKRGNPAVKAAKTAKKLSKAQYDAALAKVRF